MRVAGLAPVQIPTIENVNVTELVPGHMAYRAAMPKLLREVGWLVESDEFAEIEDPDPENHEIRQRELINEIEEARKDLEKKAQEKEKKGGKLSWWKKKKADKKDWEVYDEHSTAAPPGHRKLDQDQDPAKLAENQVMFDIDAIRKEVAALAAESKEYNAEAEFEIKEIKSTLPPMKIDIATVSPSQTTSPYSTLRETKSYNDSLGVPSTDPRKPSSSTSNGRYEEYDEFDDPGAGQMEMTFDTSFRDPPASSTTPSNYPLPASPLPAQPSRSGTSSPRDSDTPSKNNATQHPWNSDATAQPSWDDASPAERPPLRSAKTDSHATSIGGGASQAGAGAPDLGHNAWADEFEDDFGQEKEVKMSFM
jgi:hypothetical protein